MTSTAQGDSSTFSRFNDELWAIATGLVDPSEPGNRKFRSSLPPTITSVATHVTNRSSVQGTAEHTILGFNSSTVLNPVEITDQASTATYIAASSAEESGPDNQNFSAIQISRVWPQPLQTNHERFSTVHQSLITEETQASYFPQNNSRSSVSEQDNSSNIPAFNRDSSHTAALLEDTATQNSIVSTANQQSVAVLLPEDNLTLAQRLQSTDFELTGALTTEAASHYQFTATEAGVFTAKLSGLSADADLQLIQDINQNGLVDSGEIVAWEWERGSQDESIRHFLQTGDYVLRVLEQNDSPGATNYSITTNFRATETDDRAFSINVLYQQGSEQLNAQAREAIEQAASYWENIISHSSFARPLDFALGIYGTTNPDPSLLAYAGPFSYRNTGTTGNENTEDKLLPVVGFTVLNNLYLERYNSNPDYLESVVRHEIAHALGLGTIWESQGNDLVNRDQGLYRGNTYAGQSYGDLLGTGLATAVPLDEARNHWSEETFDTELLTPQAEGIGSALPLSALTISSLRDLGWHVNYGAAETFTLPQSSIA